MESSEPLSKNAASTDGKRSADQGIAQKATGDDGEYSRENANKDIQKEIECLKLQVEAKDAKVFSL